MKQSYRVYGVVEVEIMIEAESAEEAEELAKVLTNEQIFATATGLSWMVFPEVAE